MNAITFTNVSKQFPKTNYKAVKSVSFEIEEGELVTILGSSGCGKTTLLKMVNRLYDPDEGDIVLFGENIRDVDPVVVRRRIGYVIQQSGLFPHMTIEDNISTVPKLLKWDRKKQQERCRNLMELVGLDYEKFHKRYPHELSGGQQQRVGLARALAVNPKIMLMDEPFGAIDAINRLNLQDELKKIHRETNQTILFVTHDINEAFKLGNRVMIMNEGKICRFDTPQNVIRQPGDAFTQSLVQSAMDQEKFWREYRD
ncbi:MAG: ABC transporter ATP-binding protein [Hespellia sp.]|nr:ABC transporter ATP-binding protein [Hespellia sp.]